MYATVLVNREGLGQLWVGIASPGAAGHLETSFFFATRRSKREIFIAVMEKTKTKQYHHLSP